MVQSVSDRCNVVSITFEARGHDNLHNTCLVPKIGATGTLWTGLYGAVTDVQAKTEERRQEGRDRRRSSIHTEPYVQCVPCHE
jgi:hypothetical protein